MESPYHEDSAEVREQELFLQTLEDERDKEYAAHARALLSASRSKIITELEVTTEAGDTWIIEVANAWPWDDQILDLLEDQELSTYDWFQDYESIDSWESES
jgi:hypothetical protein